VTGIRKDATANAHRIPVEETKAPEDRGRYLDPLAFGQPVEKAIGPTLDLKPAAEGREALAQTQEGGSEK
jgi:hypothetical protein